MPHSTTTTQPAIGFIGLGDRGLPMATATAEAGYPLHVWPRRLGSLDALGNVAHVRHDESKDPAASCDIVALCVSTNEDVMQIVTGGLLDGLRPGSVIINHGTGTPRNAVQALTFTTMVGRPQPVAQRCEPLFGSFSRHVVYLGGPGSGQAAMLFNNALLLLNQDNIADIVELATQLRMDPSSLVDVLKLGSASSNALTLLNSMVTLDSVDHLARIEALDMQLFDTAMRDTGVNADSVTARGLTGASELHFVNSAGKWDAGPHLREETSPERSEMGFSGKTHQTKNGS